MERHRTWITLTMYLWRLEDRVIQVCMFTSLHVFSIVFLYIVEFICQRDSLVCTYISTGQGLLVGNDYVGDVSLFPMILAALLTGEDM